MTRAKFLVPIVADDAGIAARSGLSAAEVYHALALLKVMQR